MNIIAMFDVLIVCISKTQVEPEEGHSKTQFLPYFHKETLMFRWDVKPPVFTVGSWRYAYRNRYLLTVPLLFGSVPVSFSFGLCYLTILGHLINVIINERNM